MIWFRGRKNCQRISENRRIKRSRESGFSLTRYLLWCVYETVARPFRYFPCAVLPVPAEESKGWSATIFYLLYSLIGRLKLILQIKNKPLTFFRLHFQSRPRGSKLHYILGRIYARIRDFAFKKKSPILPIIYETKRGIKIRNKNYSFFMYKQSKRTPFRV